MYSHSRLIGKAADIQVEQDFLLTLMCFNNSLTDLGFEVRLFDDLKAEDVLEEIYKGRRLCICYI